MKALPAIRAGPILAVAKKIGTGFVSFVWKCSREILLTVPRHDADGNTERDVFYNDFTSWLVLNHLLRIRQRCVSLEELNSQHDLEMGHCQLFLHQI